MTFSDNVPYCYMAATYNLDFSFIPLIISDQVLVRIQHQRLPQALPQVAVAGVGQ